MIFSGTMVNIVDNSGVNRAKCIHIYSRKRLAMPGDKILVTTKRVTSSSKVKTGQLHRGIIVCSSAKNFYLGGHSTFRDMNSVILLKKNGDILGTRFSGPIFYKIWVKRLSKALTLINYVY